MSTSNMPAPSSSLPWWKEPTKDQWYAYIAAWLGWTLDAFDFTIFLLIMVPIAKEFDVPLTAVTVVFTLTLVAAPGRCHGRRLDGRSHGAQDAADDLHPVVLALQLHRGLLADLHVPVPLPCAARHRDGRGMAGRCGAGDGILAGALARLHERRPAGLVGPGLRAVGAGLRLPLRGHRLARPVVDRHPAGAGGRVDPLLRQGAGSVGREQAAADREEGRGARAAVHHLQAPAPLQHADRLPVDGRERSASTTRSGRCSRPTCRRS